MALNDIATAAAGSAVPLRTMAHQFDSSLEALTNILYLVRRSLNDPAKATKYLDLADQLPGIEAVYRQKNSDHPQGLAGNEFTGLCGCLSYRRVLGIDHSAR
jgi:hypothetical protein